MNSRPGRVSDGRQERGRRRRENAMYPAEISMVSPNDKNHGMTPLEFPFQNGPTEAPGEAQSSESSCAIGDA